MQEAVFMGIHRGFDEGVGIWRCASSASCKGARKKCKACGHEKWKHGAKFELSNQTVYECSHHVGMGDWCGCKEFK